MSSITFFIPNRLLPIKTDKPVGLAYNSDNGLVIIMADTIQDALNTDDIAEQFEKREEWYQSLKVMNTFDPIKDDGPEYVDMEADVQPEHEEVYPEEKFL